MYVKKMTATMVRSKDTMNKYIQHHKLLQASQADDFLDSLKKNSIKKFKHWIIIPNDFPYDNIATITHILFSKRKVEFDWDKLNIEEKKELDELKNGYLSEHYDVLWENLPRGKTIPGHFHLILLVLKRFKIEK